MKLSWAALSVMGQIWPRDSQITDKKSPTCEESGAHLRTSFEYLLMNFENPGKLENFEKNCWRYHYFRPLFAFYPNENCLLEKM